MQPFDENTDELFVHATIKEQKITQAENYEKAYQDDLSRAKHALKQTLKMITHNDDRLVPGIKPSTNKTMAGKSRSSLFKKRRYKKAIDLKPQKNSASISK
jgi:hypothetical protein